MGFPRDPPLPSKLDEDLLEEEDFSDELLEELDPEEVLQLLLLELDDDDPPWLLDVEPEEPKIVFSSRESTH